jgi:hypothetical protein
VSELVCVCVCVCVHVCVSVSPVQHKHCDASAARRASGTHVALGIWLAGGGFVDRPLLCISPVHEGYDADSWYHPFMSKP